MSFEDTSSVAGLPVQHWGHWKVPGICITTWISCAKCRRGLNWCSSIHSSETSCTAFNSSMEQLSFNSGASIHEVLNLGCDTDDSKNSISSNKWPTLIPAIKAACNGFAVVSAALHSVLFHVNQIVFIPTSALSLSQFHSQLKHFLFDQSCPPLSVAQAECQFSGFLTRQMF